MRDGGFGVTQWLLETALLKMEKSALDVGVVTLPVAVLHDDCLTAECGLFCFFCFLFFVFVFLSQEKS